MNRNLTTLAAAILLTTSSLSHAAMIAEPLNERAQVAQADLVFKGRVTNVDYALSGEKGDAHRIPHTFVTYEIEQVIRGNTDDKTITLRFIGGRGEEARFLMVSAQPLFDLGDRDVLMVANNNDSGCPLVDCAEGRYRLIQGKVFSEAGRALELNAKGTIEKADYYNLPEVMTHKVSQTTLRRVSHSTDGESRATFVAPGRGVHLDEDALMQRLNQSAKLSNRAAPEFKSANLNAPFSIDFSEATPVDEIAPVITKQTPRTDQERAEQAALARSGGNPVIGKYNSRAKDGAK